MKKITLLAVLFAVLLNSSAFSQNIIGKSYAGASIGTGWGNLGFSANFEKVFKEIESLGVIGAGIEIGYASVGSVYIDNYTYVPILLFGSFHYKVSNPKLDPYARLGIGYIYINWPGEDIGVWTPHKSYISLAGQIGIRYQLSDKIWLRGALGTPFAISAGVDFEI